MVAQGILPIGRQVLQTGHEDLTLFAQRARHQGHANPLIHVARHQPTGADRLVVGVGMDDQDSSVGHEAEA